MGMVIMVGANTCSNSDLGFGELMNFYDHEEDSCHDQELMANQCDQPWWSEYLPVPEDNLEDIEFFPNFGDASMSLPDIILTTPDMPQPPSPDDFRDLVDLVLDDHRSESTTNGNPSKPEDHVVCKYQNMSTNGDRSERIHDLAVCDAQNISTNGDHSEWIQKVCDNQSISTNGDHSKRIQKVCDNQTISTNCETRHKPDNQSISTNGDHSERIHEVCDNQSISTNCENLRKPENQSRSTNENYSNQVEQVCDNQSRSTNQNHSKPEIWDNHTKTTENRSKVVEILDNQTTEILSGVNARSTLYGTELHGFATKKMRSKRVSTRSVREVAAAALKSSKRKCTHCQTESTPQWRLGPMGPKTLCNACGVRYQTGRLVPEYRPAASPTFDVSKHSNFHKRILKRKAKMMS